MPAAKPPEFRRRALDRVAAGEPVAKVARELSISESCLRRWMDVDDVDAGRKAGLTTAEYRELVELRRRNRVLEMELEILKRASAYFARENVLPLPSLSPRIGLGASAWALRYDGVLLLVMIHFVVSPRGSGGG